MNVPLKCRTALLLLCAALLPSAWLAWQWRAMPQTGIFHDDALYLVAGQSMAAGNGYRIASLPGQPYQTKYPPLYAALLSIVWQLDPRFPENLPKVMFLAWLMLPGVVLLTWRLMRGGGFSEAESVGLAAFLALAPAAVQFSVVAMSELPFCALLFASLIFLERGQAWRAGLFAALAFLTRGAALPLLVTAPAVFWWRGERTRAMKFAAVFAPVVIGWQLWAATHRAPADALTLFYTDYFGFHRQDVPLADWPNLFASNLSPAMKAIGDLLVFDPDTGFGALTLARLLTVASISGCLRLMRAGRLVMYGWFGAFYLLQFLFWNYPPTSRFFVPLLPLAAAGVWREGQSLQGIMAIAWRKGGADRVVAVAVSLFIAFVSIQSLRSSYWGIRTGLPEVFARNAGQLEKKREAHRWLREHAGPNSAVLSYEDPLDFLYTGRPGYSLRVAPGALKRADPAEIAGIFARLPQLLASHHVDHVLVSEADYHMDCPELTVKPYRALFQNPVFEREGVAIFRLNAVSPPAAKEPTEQQIAASPSPAKQRRQ